MQINPNEIKVKVKFLEDKKLKAIISLDFGDFIVKGFRLMVSEFENKQGDKLWLTPPSYPGGGKYHPIFFMPDKSLWEQLENKILAEYKKQDNERYKKMYGIDDGELS